jgi:MFS family permease
MGLGPDYLCWCRLHRMCFISGELTLFEQILIVLSLTNDSGQASFSEAPIAREFHVSKEVTILGISLYVLGLGIGPLIAGPLSEVGGRRGTILS